MSKANKPHVKSDDEPTPVQPKSRPDVYIAVALDDIPAATRDKHVPAKAELYSVDDNDVTPTGTVITVWHPFRSPISAGTRLNLSDKDGIVSMLVS